MLVLPNSLIWFSPCSVCGTEGDPAQCSGRPFHHRQTSVGCGNPIHGGNPAVTSQRQYVSRDGLTLLHLAGSTITFSVLTSWTHPCHSLWKNIVRCGQFRFCAFLVCAAPRPSQGPFSVRGLTRCLEIWSTIKAVEVCCWWQTQDAVYFLPCSSPPLAAESVIRDMVGPDWKQRWMNWKNRTPEQVRVWTVANSSFCITGFFLCNYQEGP